MTHFLEAFRSELVKTGAAERLSELVKQADIGASPAPSGMMDNGPVPPSIDVRPTEAGTRVPDASHAEGMVQAGSLGEVTPAKDPIDRQKFNRAYEGTRKN